MENVADPKRIDEKKYKEKLFKDKEKSDLKFLLNTEQGRRFIWRYLEFCGVYKSSFTGSSQTFFLEGQRNVGLKLVAEIVDAQPEMYLKMMIENKKEN